MSNITIAYIGGGSRGWALGLMSDLAAEEALCGTVKLYDIDKDAAICNEIIGNKLYDRIDTKGKWRYKAVDSLKESLTGADFVIISILPGTFNEMKSDVHAPEKYGIYQSVGDTVGPGGFMRAIRTIPMYVEIATAIKNFAPEAWVINYTNPMSLCVKTLYEVFPEIKAFGCCHEVFGTQKVLACALKDIRGIENIKREDIKINVLGINHFTWIDRASYKNIDLIPVYEEFVQKYYEVGFDGVDDGHWMNDTFACANRVKFDLYKKFGLIAAAGDRHLAEFMPGNWYLKDKKTVKRWMFGLTTVDSRIEDLKKRLEKSRRLVSGQDEFIINQTGEEGVRQIKALLGLEDLVTNVNLPNKGQVKNIKDGAIVETNALFRKDSIAPIMAGELPDHILSIVNRHISNQETVLKSTLSENVKMAYTAFINDPLANLERKASLELFKKMIENTKEYLPEFWLSDLCVK
ncbi:alpha-glucosidase/alpha-galactosidase [Clostridium cibarium]|nr:alpha-glucosidase/alpha-galactosidase [Clostridium cibarium]